MGEFFSTDQRKFDIRLEEVSAVGIYSAIFPPAKGQVIALTDEELGGCSSLADLRLHRILGRSGLLLLSLFPELSAGLSRRKHSSWRVGIYGSAVRGPTSMPLIRSAFQSGTIDFSENVRRIISPKQNFREGINYPVAQLAIALNVNGPTGTFPSLRFGAEHAIEAAWMDFRNGSLDAAIIFASCTLENPVVNQAMLAAFGPRGLVESASALLVDSETECAKLAQHIQVQASQREVAGGAEVLRRAAGCL